LNLLTEGIGSGLGAPIGVNVRLTLVTVGESFDTTGAFAGADNCLGTGLGAMGLGPVILALTGALVLGAVSDLVTKLDLALGAGSVSTVLFFAAGAAVCLEAASAALAALMAVSLAA